MNIPLHPLTPTPQSWTKAHYRRGRALLALGRHADAIDALERLRCLEPDHEDVGFYLQRARTLRDRERE
jgi:hypothetical protein